MVLSVLISLMFVALGWSLAYSPKEVDLEKSSPYECGFSCFQSSRSPFSIYFFLLAILFVVFDIELVILLPYCFLSFCCLFSFYSSVQLVLFLLVLYLGLIYEWREGCLEWGGGH
nr:NADH dehydrogenase subunit 3 [Ficopomatus enigmaticus]